MPGPDQGPPAPALLLTHRIHCDQCFHALLRGEQDTASCADGLALIGAAQAALARPAAQPAATGTPGGCQAGVDR